MITPVNTDELERQLKESTYSETETRFLVQGFRFGFDLGYRGPEVVQRRAPNLKLTIGTKTTLWNKMMKEVQLKRFAGPFNEISFEHFIQSPVGLVPKDNGKQTHLIFHLSYPRTSSSVNSETPRELCSVHYPDFSVAVRRCLEEGKFCFLAKSDMKSAFRNLAILLRQYKYLVMFAVSPWDNKPYFFIDKCLPFGVSISCAVFQRFSNAIAHLTYCRSLKLPVNYLDDFCFMHLLQEKCDSQVCQFLDICEAIRFPVSMEKTYWSMQFLSFLGFLIDTVSQIISVPVDKFKRLSTLLTP